MKTNETHKKAVGADVATAEEQHPTAFAKSNASAAEATAPVGSAVPIASAACAETLQPETSPGHIENADNVAGKIPPLDLGEDRMKPITAPTVRVDNSETTSVADKAAASKFDVSAVIKAIVTAMDIDTRLAHALVDIHTGVDTAEAFARAYGVTLPAGKGEAVPDVRPDQTAKVDTAEGGALGAVDASVARLPEQAASVPTFLCNPRRGFWD